jgi:hypothetical protein
MKVRITGKAPTPKPPNRGRHEAECRICRHRQREEIERAFVNWSSPASIAQTYRLRDRSTVYRHAHAFNLFEKRKANIRAALEAIIERAADVEVTASAVVAAIQAYAKINDVGKWIERRETVNLSELFNRMTVDELENYARTGELPGWFPVSPVATSSDGRERTN